MPIGGVGVSEVNLAIGAPITGSTATRVLFTGTGGVLASLSTFTVDVGTGVLTAAGYTVGATPGIDASINVAAAGTITVVKGIITAFA